MKQSKKVIPTIIAAFVLILLILDAKASTQYAFEGLQLCLKALVPSLFPLLFLSVYMNGTLLGIRFPGLSTLGKLCKMPSGSESVLLLGLLGGYPVGAQMISQCYQKGGITKESAERLSGFCSNAGPAFIFGVTGQLFTSAAIPWYLWEIQILSAILVGMLLPGTISDRFQSDESETGTLPQALQKSVSIMAGICGWVIVFRVIIGMCQRWFLWLLPDYFQLLFSGFMELSNGITGLSSVSSEAERFLLASCFLSAGGLCVSMQSVTALSPLGCSTYFRGKALQTILSFLLSYCIQFFVFPECAAINPQILYPLLMAALCMIPLLRRCKSKKGVAFA